MARRQADIQGVDRQIGSHRRKGRQTIEIITDSRAGRDSTRQRSRHRKKPKPGRETMRQVKVCIYRRLKNDIHYTLDFHYTTGSCRVVAHVP